MKYAIALVLLATTARADPPKVINVTTSAQGGEYRFAVTLLHPDTGWTHYADGWRIETKAGNPLGTRVLAHPHENEQPFTRSLGGIVLPKGATQVYLRAKCLVDGWNDQRSAIPLP